MFVSDNAMPQGDSGSPLMRKREDGRFELVGITSGGSYNCTQLHQLVTGTLQNAEKGYEYFINMWHSESEKFLSSVKP